ncbi:F0F1 ATP synthase subunit delta [Acidocella sp. KAb 2-4]|uniref:F0F1 ATP synthase subunit delta n=1 Tax=Acidocella sp. KAb 2-4 TaxID=2885158 RepID=UPI001D0881E3|nr:F0F1 ATP synthase subunit delta [Acidocella sp. KAb 2-4]MCB5945605.1 F0F1 ATP synthase subunit delta [Acidocella sp. KAb 2-4]
MSIDFGTLALQAVNVLILIWLLQRFFWRPVAAIIAQRRAAAQAMLDDAAKRQAEAEAQMAGIEQVRAGFAQERAAILAAAQAEAASLRAAAEAEAASAAKALEAATRVRLSAEEKTAMAALRGEAAELAVRIAGRLVARLDAPALRAAFLDSTLRELATLPAELRQGVRVLTVTSPAPLPPEEQTACAARLRTALGGEVAISFAADPAVLAGLELAGGALSLRNSWRADLERLRAELDHAA